MRVKLIRAASMRLAMDEAYALMGPDALIIDSRKCGNQVEISVAIDPEQPPEPVDPARPHGSDEAWLEALVYHNIPPRLADLWMAKAPVAALSASFRFGTINFDRPLLLAGPPGAGKTMTTIKLATRLVLEGIKPTIVNADQHRAGASAQLATLSRILRAEFIDTSQTTAKRAKPSAKPSSKTPAAPRTVLIDLPGMDAFSDRDMDDLRAMIDSVSGTAALVMPAGLDAVESGEIAERFYAAGATTLIPTRLDLSRRLGGMIAAADAAPLTLTDAGTSGRVSDGLHPLTPRFMASRLLGQTEKDRVAHAA
ncbi:GTP-binding protein [Acidiphilium sp.]|uniref:flagellar biosynthesis protein FlhF n=1 Tax=Acidiphilium sp. TaxID=527 RepID=UPI003D07E86C